MAAPAPPHIPPRVVGALLAHAIDYAGLYPPAALRMADAVHEYHAQRSRPHRWALGRFVVAANQLDTFVAERRKLPGEPWPLSVPVTDHPLNDTAETHADLLRVDAIEAKGDSPAAIARVAPLASLAPELYVEVPLNDQLEALLAAIHALGARAKVRTGGVTADAIPSAESVARFLRACVDAGIPFKATAGLHHLVRGEYALTYEPGSPRGTMFGFLNVFVAAALAYRGASRDTLTRVLEERSAAAFQTSLSGDELCWREECLTVDQVREARGRAITSVGSCSFSEPLAELAAAGLAAAP